MVAGASDIDSSSCYSSSSSSDEEESQHRSWVKICPQRTTCNLVVGWRGKSGEHGVRAFVVFMANSHPLFSFYLKQYRVQKTLQVCGTKNPLSSTCVRVCSWVFQRCLPRLRRGTTGEGDDKWYQSQVQGLGA
jgi:hypothetical protein